MIRFSERRVLELILSSLFLLVSLNISKAGEDQATVLLALQPTKISGSSWDFGKGADPVLCLRHGCYVGRGFTAPAKYFFGRSAYLPAVQARACRNSLTCIYRNVSFPDRYNELWPVDLDGFTRDYMENSRVRIDHSCASENGELKCLNGIFTQEYSLWVIPEKIAGQVGKKALDFALYKGLHDARERYINGFLEERLMELPNTVSGFYRLVLGRDIPQRCASNAEVIAEAFYVSGILKSENRDSDPVIRHVFNRGSYPDLKKALLKHPADFWKFRDALGRLETFARADTRQEITHQKGITYQYNGHTTTLLVGWEVRSRADRIVNQCVSDITVSKAW